MRLEMVLNELSLIDSDADERIARKLMSTFIRTLSLAERQGIKTLRTESKISQIMIAPGYPISKWLNDGEVNREQQDFLLTLATQSPLLNEIKDSIIQDKVDLSEFKYQGVIATELGIAYLLEYIAISFRTQDKWKNSHLELEMTTYEDNEDNDELNDRQVTVIHASCKSHIEEHSNWVKDRIRSSVNDGQELWNRKKELFPNLEFCNSVETQICCIDKSDIILGQVRKRLNELEDYCKNWTNGAFDYNKIPSRISTESNSRKNKFKDRLTFQYPNGNKHLFSFHARMIPDAWRLHFYPEAQSRKIIIGYIGIKIQ